MALTDVWRLATDGPDKWRFGAVRTGFDPFLKLAASIAGV